MITKHTPDQNSLLLFIPLTQNHPHIHPAPHKAALNHNSTAPVFHLSDLGNPIADPGAESRIPTLDSFLFLDSSPDLDPRDVEEADFSEDLAILNFLPAAILQLVRSCVYALDSDR